IRGLVRKNKYSQHVIVNELGVDNYGLADSNKKDSIYTFSECIELPEVFSGMLRKRREETKEPLQLQRFFVIATGFKPVTG
ncbi:hypothetical protein, partial [Prevotella heparinolytica]|uniref:hypothetical protein n=1 Tax=Prevotella heparinolytica TaxID=28113 RepID=UPI001BE0B56A